MCIDRLVMNSYFGREPYSDVGDLMDYEKLVDEAVKAVEEGGKEVREVPDATPASVQTVSGKETPTEDDPIMRRMAELERRIKNMESRFDELEQERIRSPPRVTSPPPMIVRKAKTQAKPECENCGRSFRNRGNLINHLTACKK